MRNGSLWSAIVFEKDVIFHEFDFKTSDLELKVSKSTIWTHTTSCDKGGFFLSLLSRKFDDRLSSNFHRFVILCICWDTPTVKASLWQLPIVYTAFKINGNQKTVGFKPTSVFYHKAFWPNISLQSHMVLLKKKKKNNFFFLSPENLISKTCMSQTFIRKFSENRWLFLRRHNRSGFSEIKNAIAFQCELSTGYSFIV